MVGIVIPLMFSWFFFTLWLYKYRETMKFSFVLGWVGKKHQMSFSVTKLKANLTNFLHSCCDRALQEELVLLDVSHKIKAT